MTDPIPNRPGRRRALALTGLGVGAAVTAAVAAERILVRRARAMPDRARHDDLAERPGPTRMIRSFDGTEITLTEIGPTESTVEPVRTLVFCHAFTLDMTAWHYQWKELSKRYGCVLYDHRSHGRIGRAGEGGYSIQALGQDLKRVLDATVEGPPAALIGHSMGGMAIASLAEMFPEEFGTRVRGAVFANTAAADVLKAIIGNLGVRASQVLLPVARRITANSLRGYRIRSSVFRGQADLAFPIARLSNFGSTASPSIIDHVVRLSGQVPLDVWTELITSMFEMDLGEALSNVRVPSLVLVGDVDRLTPPSSALALKRRLPDARMIVFRDVGHCAMLEHPDEFNRVVEEFLAGAFAPAPEIVST
ncbi:MAG: alpha/beta fold hydrolase [Actinomycetota bacterium]